MRTGNPGPKMRAIDEGKPVEFEMVDDYVLITDATGDTACVPAKAMLRYADRVREDEHGV